MTMYECNKCGSRMPEDHIVDLRDDEGLWYRGCECGERAEEFDVIEECMGCGGEFYVNGMTSISDQWYCSKCAKEVPYV